MFVRPSSSGDRAPASGAGSAGSIPAWGTQEGANFGRSLFGFDLVPSLHRNQHLVPSPQSWYTSLTSDVFADWRRFDSCLGHYLKVRTRSMAVPGPDLIPGLHRSQHLVPSVHPPLPANR